MMSRLIALSGFFIIMTTLFLVPTTEAIPDPDTCAPCGSMVRRGIPWGLAASESNEQAHTVRILEEGKNSFTLTDQHTFYLQATQAANETDVSMTAINNQSNQASPQMYYDFNDHDDDGGTPNIWTGNTLHMVIDHIYAADSTADFVINHADYTVEFGSKTAIDYSGTWPSAIVFEGAKTSDIDEVSELVLYPDGAGLVDGRLDLAQIRTDDIIDMRVKISKLGVLDSDVNFYAVRSNDDQDDVHVTMTVYKAGILGGVKGDTLTSQFFTVIDAQ